LVVEGGAVRGIQAQVVVERVDARAAPGRRSGREDRVVAEVAAGIGEVGREVAVAGEAQPGKGVAVEGERRAEVDGDRDVVVVAREDAVGAGRDVEEGEGGSVGFGGGQPGVSEGVGEAAGNGGGRGEDEDEGGLERASWRHGGCVWFVAGPSRDGDLFRELRGLWLTELAGAGAVGGC